MKLLISMVENGVNNTGMNGDGGSEFYNARGKDLKVKGPQPEERLAPGRKKRRGHGGHSLHLYTLFSLAAHLRHR